MNLEEVFRQHVEEKKEPLKVDSLGSQKTRPLTLRAAYLEAAQVFTEIYERESSKGKADAYRKVRELKDLVESSSPLGKIKSAVTSEALKFTVAEIKALRQFEAPNTPLVLKGQKGFLLSSNAVSLFSKGIQSAYKEKSILGLKIVAFGQVMTMFETDFKIVKYLDGQQQLF